jgi:hypothetical protein
MQGFSASGNLRPMQAVASAKELSLGLSASERPCSVEFSATGISAMSKVIAIGGYIS